MSEYEKQHDLFYSVPWKNLILLDACRYDIFEELNDIPGDLKPVWSIASNSYPWVMEVIAPNTFPNTILFMGNSFIGKWVTRFYYTRRSFLRDWKEDIGAVCPYEMNRYIIKSLRNHPDQRMWIWYMQPHLPYIGEPRFTWKEVGEKKETGRVFKDKVIIGEIPLDRAIAGYKGNLRHILGAVKEILPHMKGKTIITSDHGEFLGENGIYGHENKDSEDPIVRLIPWLEMDL